MGSFMSGALGVNNDYQASNPYSTGQFLNNQQHSEEIYGQQQELAKALQGQMNGTGPNPAQAQFNQNVQQNNANAQGLIASQRGLNPALATRMGANAAGAANMAGAQQSGIMQQQQQVAAANQLGSLYGQMQGGNLGNQGLYNQANMNSQNLNQRSAAQNANTAGSITGGLLGSLGAAGVGMAHGGQVEPVQHYDMGGDVNAVGFVSQFLATPGSAAPADDTTSGAEAMGKGAKGATQGAGKSMMNLYNSKGASATGNATPSSNISMAGGDAESGAGPGKAMAGGPMDAGGIDPTSFIGAHGGLAARNFKLGGHIPGKAKVKGNSYKNDTVPAVLSPGEVVIPRSVMNSEDAAERAKQFVAAILAKKGKGKSK